MARQGQLQRPSHQAARARTARGWPALRYLVAGLLLLVIAGPFYWILTSSLKQAAEIIRIPPTYLPRSLTLAHYRRLFEASDYPRFLLNSTLVALWTMLITVVLATLAAYALYRLRFPGRSTIMRLLLVTYIFPGILLLVPLYQLLSQLGLVGRLSSLVIVNVTFAAPFAVWLLRAFFTSLPREIEEAAAIDGAGLLRQLVQIVLPLTAPGMATVAIYAFLTSWTEYLFASVLTIDSRNYTLPVGLAGSIGQYQVDWGLLTAGAIVTTLPVLLLFAFVGRYFIEGLTAGALKE